MLIPGGLGETEESKEIAARMIERIREAHGKGDGGPVFLGANCMGVISRPGNYDTWFIPAEKLQAARRTSWRRTAIVSQSGAFLVTKSGDKIAKYFGISKYTLYSYIDKQQEEK